MQFINTNTQFEQQHFDLKSCTVLSHRGNIGHFLGVALSDQQLIQLAGAPSYSTIEVIEKPTWSAAELPDGEQVPPGLLLRVHNGQYLEQANEMVIFRDEAANRYSVYLKLIMFQSDIKGLAARMLAIIVRAARQLPNARRLMLQAAGGRRWPAQPSGKRWGGYMAWPTYGFDMELLQDTRAMAQHFPYIPEKISACNSVSAVLKLSGGREYWRLVGDGDYMEFDLANNSPSLTTLDQFLQRTGL